MNPQATMLLEEMYLKLVQRRIVCLNEEIDRESIFKVRYYIEKIVTKDEALGIKPKNAEPITLRIDSYGGCANSTMHLVAYIQSLQKKGYKINTESLGVSMSGGFKVLIVGTHRSAYKYSDIMVHQPNSFQYGTSTFKDKQIDYEQTKKLWDMLKKFISENTKITEEQLDAYTSKNENWHMTAEEALELGVIDEVL